MVFRYFGLLHPGRRRDCANPGGWPDQIQNAGRTNKKGFEFSGDYQLFKGLTLGGNYTFSDYKYDDFIDREVTIQVTRCLRAAPSVQPVRRLPASWRLQGTAAGQLLGSYYLDAANSEEYGGYDFVTDLSMG